MESKWKQIVGKKISEGAYINSDSLRQDYAKVMPSTCLVLGNEAERVKQLERKLNSNKDAFNLLVSALARRKLLPEDYTTEDLLHDQEEHDKQAEDSSKKNKESTVANPLLCSVSLGEETLYVGSCRRAFASANAYAFACN